ncbi:19445_t:CDS:2 [Funneliformis geosporum]|uniref:19445_t:CDS:1 n=1 Tax=Funneliformis geosporum TaxID=1117311 RepID=A0A9W4WVR2_9GLOM|nr:19445_t:CDS:2 [Funneliformis geosporum]
MVLKNNIERTLRDLESRIEELEQSNEGLCSQFKFLEEKIRERDEEAKVKQKTINNLEEIEGSKI